MSKSKIPTLDLHGYTTDEVYDAIEKFLATHGRRPQVRIMPGKGTGAVKKVAIAYLKQAGYPWNFERDDQGRVNEGVLVVFCD